MTSEVEVNVRSEVKFEVRSSKRLSRCTSIQNFRFLALKMTELWQFELKNVRTLFFSFFSCLVTWEYSSKSKSIWPITFAKFQSFRIWFTIGKSMLIFCLFRAHYTLRNPKKYSTFFNKFLKYFFQFENQLKGRILSKDPSFEFTGCCQ